MKEDIGYYLIVQEKTLQPFRGARRHCSPLAVYEDISVLLQYPVCYRSTRMSQSLASLTADDRSCKPHQSTSASVESGILIALVAFANAA